MMDGLMDSYRLSFATINILRSDIAEVIVDDGIEMDASMVAEYHDFLLANLSAPFSLLINKLHSYTYTFDAQKQLATLEEINLMAVVSYRSVSTASTDALVNLVSREKDWNLRIFSDRAEALNWLAAQQDQIATNN